jgi:hypothetical protein
MESIVSIMETVLSSDTLLYVGMIVEGLVSIFLWKKQKQPKSTGTIVTEDLQALVDYHKNVAKKLEERISKGG